MIRWGATALLVLMTLWPGTPARAQSCTLSMSIVDFGSFSPLSPAPTEIVVQATIACTGFATPYVRACASLGTRGMTRPGGATLSYELYIDSARTRAWGSVWNSATKADVLVGDIITSSGAGSTMVPVYGRVFGSQTQLPAGSYSQLFNGAGYTSFQAAGYSSTPPVCSSSLNWQPEFIFSTAATVVPDCVVSATNIDFGPIGFINAPVNATGIVTATCSNGTNYALSLGAGQGAGATVAARSLTRSGGGGTLGYRLYSDAARTQAWGDGSAGTTTVAATGTGNAQTATVYATLPVQPAAPPGSYADTVIVTVTY